MKTGLIFFFCLLFGSATYGQIQNYDYKRELEGITDTWHKIVLPDEIFEKISSGLSDIRIYGITTGNDTLEAPYILQRSMEEVSRSDVNFNLINRSKDENRYYFTFENPLQESVNLIKLEFLQSNFDWRLQLEGSNNQQEWFILAENYRILSIKNEETDYRYTDVSFPDSRYRFFRISVSDAENPELQTAGVSFLEVHEATYRDYKIESVKKSEARPERQTIIDIGLERSVPVSYLKIGVTESFDYYRPVSVQYLADSLETEQGWRYHYNSLVSGTLSSAGKNEFRFESTLLKKLRIIIHNGDNSPLTLDAFEVKGYLHELAVRFTEPATYFLVYGNRTAPTPHYDIHRFTDNIPPEMTAVTFGIEQQTNKKVTPATGPLFENRAWLWGIMTITIVLLGWFSIKMIKNR